MKVFTVYNLVSGSIIRTGTCQDETFEAQAMNPGEGVIEGYGDWSTQCVVDGQLRDISVQ